MTVLFKRTEQDRIPDAFEALFIQLVNQLTEGRTPLQQAEALAEALYATCLGGGPGASESFAQFVLQCRDCGEGEDGR